MRLISRHILRALAAPFFWGVLALTGLLLLSQLAILIDKFGGRGLGFDVMIEAIILSLPALLTLTIPMSVLVATLYAYSSLAADMEMVAMYANGISVWRMVRPALLAAVAIAAFNFLLFDQVVPLSNTRYRTLSSDVFRKTPTLSLRAQTLNELETTGYLIWAQTVDAVTGQMKQVKIWDLRQSQGNRVIHADSGRMVQAANGRDLLMTLHNGDQLDFSARTPGKVEQTSFIKNQIRIADATSEFERRQSQSARGDRERSGCELLNGVDQYKWTASDGLRQMEYLTRRDLYHLLKAKPLAPPALQARPEFQKHCTGVWQRLGEFFEKLLLPKEVQAQTPLTRKQVQDPATSAEVTVDQNPSQRLLGDSLTQNRLFPAGTTGTQRPGFLVDPNEVAPRTNENGVVATMAEVIGARVQRRQASRSSNEYAVEYHKKFAIPLASFCFVLLGIALALKFPRSGIGLVIGASMIVFLAFYVLLIGGENIANEGVVSAPVAMYGPVALFTALGLVSVAMANREMGTARTSGIVEWIVGLWSRRGSKS